METTGFHRGGPLQRGSGEIPLLSPSPLSRLGYERHLLWTDTVTTRYAVLEASISALSRLRSTKYRSFPAVKLVSPFIGSLFKNAVVGHFHALDVFSTTQVLTHAVGHRGCFDVKWKDGWWRYSPVVRSCYFFCESMRGGTRSPHFAFFGL